MPVIQANDPDRTQKEMIIALVQRWKAKHPHDWAVFALQTKEKRDNLTNENGISADGTHRYEASVPKSLFNQIEFAVSATGTKLEESHYWPWLLESFPEFRIGKPKRR